jgi:hypothetical protein
MLFSHLPPGFLRGSFRRVSQPQRFRHFASALSWNKEKIITEVETVVGSVNKTGNVSITLTVSRSHYYSGEAMSITYAERVCNALVLSRVRRMRLMVL